MPSRRAAGEKRIIGFGLAAVLVLLGGLALLIAHTDHTAHSSLDERFGSRAELTASFTHDFLEDAAARERRQAERLLAAPDVNEAMFDQVVESLDLDAAVLLDDQGRLLHVYPSQPSLLGRDMTEQYPHLRAAVDGAVGISPVVPSASEGIPVTAVATPFDTPQGRRVFSGAISPGTGALGAYFRSVVPVYGGNAFLVDGSGNLITDGHGTTPRDPALLTTTERISHQRFDGVSVTVASVPVQGTPWRVIAVANSAGLYGPIAAGRWAPWSLWGALAVAGFVAVWLAVRLNRARAAADGSARTDALTGLPNRRAMLEVLEREVHQASRADAPLAVLLIDIDHFKSINDTYGHPAGDAALRILGDVFRMSLRKGDVAGRWGGEEFLVVLFPTSVEGPLEVAERVRAAVADAPMPFGGPHERCTVSVGVAVVDGTDTEAALRAADHALYLAKQSGRNRVESAVASAK